MVFPGHIAAAYLAAHYAKLDEKVVLAAAVFPDVVDKTVRYILRLTPNGRIPAHALLSLALTAGLVWLIWRRRALTLAWVAGYASHLLMDLVVDLVQWGGGVEFLFWPVAPARLSRYHTLLGSVMDYAIWAYVVELAVCAWAVVVALRARRLRLLSGEGSMAPTHSEKLRLD